MVRGGQDVKNRLITNCKGRYIRNDNEFSLRKVTANVDHKVVNSAFRLCMIICAVCLCHFVHRLSTTHHRYEKQLVCLAVRATIKKKETAKAAVIVAAAAKV